MQEAGDNLALLEVSMEGMNAIPDPSNEEERKGCSGHISKLIIGSNDQTNKIAMVAYVAEDLLEPFGEDEALALELGLDPIAPVSDEVVQVGRGRVQVARPLLRARGGLRPAPASSHPSVQISTFFQ